MSWKLPNDAQSYYRPRKLSEFLGFANRPAIRLLRMATRPTWSGKFLLCGPHKSGLTTLINLMARDVNRIPAPPQYFTVSAEVAWEQTYPGVKKFHGIRETLFIEGRVVSLSDLQRTIPSSYLTQKRYVLIDNLELFANQDALNMVCDYIRDTADDVIVTVHTEEIKELARDRLCGDLHKILRTIPISYPEPAYVEQLAMDLSDRNIISIEDPYLDNIISLVEGDLQKLLWILGKGHYVSEEGYCAILEWILAVQ